MAKQTINPGTAPTGAGGDTFRSGSAKLQANDDELYAQLGATAQGVLPEALPINNGGTGATTAAAARISLGLGTAALLDATTSRIDLSAGRVLKVSDFGLGGNAHPIQGENLTLGGCGFVTGNEAWGYSLTSQYGVGISTQRLNGTSPQQFSMLVLPYGTGLRPFNVSIVTKWNAAIYETLILTNRNTSTDGNGFIKAASPIVQLFSDKIELNEEAKLQNITFEKLAIGNYLIKNSSGFAQEGWYIETPKDANGNVLFSVIYTTLENGDISVKTYKKKFDLGTASIVADLDNPVDVTENRWIDLRLQELPQAEIEMPESIAPPDFQPAGLAEAVAIVMESYHDSEQ